jgi:hypothetical protein
MHGEIYSRDACLVRDTVDPLLLRLTYLHSRNNSQTPNERWTFFIRMPRMYPHAPPTITRVMRDIVPNDENAAYSVNVNNLDYHHNNSASAVILASSRLLQEPPVPKQVTIRLLPPSLHHSVPLGGNVHVHGVTKDWDIDLATSVCDEWTPVSTMQDLIDFLVKIPARRREWWSKESNRRHHLQQQRYCNN